MSKHRGLEEILEGLLCAIYSSDSCIDLVAQAKQDIIALVVGADTENPYPESIFPEPSDTEWETFKKALAEYNLKQDRFFGSFGRLVWENSKADTVKAILNKLGE